MVQFVDGVILKIHKSQVVFRLSSKCKGLGECIFNGCKHLWVRSCGSVVRNLPAMQEMWIPSLGWEDPLEKEMATCSSILSRRIPRTEDPGGLQSIGSQRLDMTEMT